MVRTLLKKDWFPEDGFPIVVEWRDPQEPFGLHAHEFSEIVIILGGRGMHITGEDSYELTAGDTFVIGGDRPHDYVNMQGLRLVNILFDPKDLPMSFCDLPSLPGYHALFMLEPAWRKRHRFSSRLQLSPADLLHASNMVRQLEMELENRESGFRAVATAQFLQLATFLSRCYSRSNGPQNQALLRIAAAITHLEQNYGEDITLADLVEMSGMSRRNFVRAFESSMGCPPITYLIRLRIRHACALLQQKDLNITEVAMQTGFNDSNYFSRQFRAIVGVSPRQYRQRLTDTSVATKVSAR